MTIDATRTSERAHGQSALEAILTLGGIQVLIMGAALVRTKLLAILLGPEGIGITGVIDQIVAFAAHAGSLSIPFAALRFLSRTRGLSTEKFLSLYRAFRRTLLVASFVGGAAGVVFILLQHDSSSNGLAANRIAALVAILSVPALAILSLERNVLAVLEKPRVAALTTLVAAIALVASTYAGVKWGGITGLYIGNLVVNVAIIILVARFVRLSMPTGEPQASQSPLSVIREEKGVVRFCTLIHFLALGSPAAYAVSRIVTLDSGGSAMAGLMGAVFGIGVAVRTVLSQANALYLVPLASQSTPKELRADAVSHFARVLSVLFVVCAFPLALFPEFWLRLLYSRAFVSAAPTLPIFLIAEGLLLMAGVFQALLIGFDDLRGYLASSVIASATVIGLSFAFIPPYGIAGAAWALVTGNLVLMLLTMIRLELSHSVAGLMIKVAPLVAALIALDGAGRWGSQYLVAPLLRIVVCVVASVAFLALLTPAERSWISSPVRERLRAGT